MIVQAPVVDWQAGRLLVGMLYATVRTPDARVLAQPAGQLLGWLADAGQLLFGRLRR
ncbi:MAG: hypothetical protein IT561_00995 [Alphaproteobacteria bacterium]|nr:hypothetical protein [Alphaproteobacteria bacterium]